MRLLGTLARLALFQPEPPRAAPFIATESRMPIVSWIRCHLLASHDYGVRCEPGRIFLACRGCGTRSRGWAFDQIPYEARTRVAETAARAPSQTTAPALTRTSPEPAVPVPAVTLAAPRAPRLWRAVRAGGRTLMDIHWLRGAPAEGRLAMDLGVRAIVSSARVRVHAARDPPRAWRTRTVGLSSTAPRPRK
jgi:hypothetical protein